MNSIRTNKYILLFLTFWMCACSSTTNIKNDNGVIIENPNSESLKKYIGKKITVTGKSVNIKLGAGLILENGQLIWINKMESWPAGYYLGDDKTKTLKVVGILIEKNDLPVFFQKENDKLIKGGIPVPEGTDIKKASHRFLLKNIKWDIIE